MKSNIILIQITFLFILFFVSSCNDELINYDKNAYPIISVAYDSLDIDLNLGVNLPIVTVVKSKNGLKSVKMYIEHGGAVGEVFYKEITEFFNENQLSINERPMFDGSEVAFVVYATDKADLTTKYSLKLNAIPYKDAPTVIIKYGNLEYSKDSTIVLDELSGELQKIIDVSITGITKLKQVTIYHNYKDGSKITLDDKVFTNSEMSYNYQSTEANPINITSNSSSFQVLAVDVYGKTKNTYIAIKFIKTAPPVIKMLGDISTENADTCITGDINSSKEFAFQATSSVGFTSVKIEKTESNAAVTTGYTPTTTSIVDDISLNFENTYDYSRAITLTDKLVSFKITTTEKNNRSYVVNVSNYVGIRCKKNITIGSQMFAWGDVPEYPNLYSFFSFSSLNTISPDIAYNNDATGSPADMVCTSTSAAVTAGYIRMNGIDYSPVTPVFNSSNYEYYTTNGSTKTAPTLPYRVPKLEDWKNRNATLFTTAFTNISQVDFEKISHSTLASFAGSLTQKRMGTFPFAVGQVYYFKTAATSSLPSKVGVLRIEKKQENMYYPNAIWGYAAGTYPSDRTSIITISVKILN